MTNLRRPNKRFASIVRSRPSPEKARKLELFSAEHPDSSYGFLAKALVLPIGSEAQIEEFEKAISHAIIIEEIGWSYFLFAEFLMRRLRQQESSAKPYDLILSEALLLKVVAEPNLIPEASIQLAVLYSSWGRYDCFVRKPSEAYKWARKQFLAQYREKPTAASIYEYCTCILLNDRPQRAIRPFAIAYKHFPTSPEIILGLAEAYDCSHLQREAEHYYSIANQMRPHQLHTKVHKIRGGSDDSCGHVSAHFA